MITGSHNPPEDNGFKMMLGTETLHGAAIAELRDRGRGAARASPRRIPTHAMHSRDVIGAYLDHAVGQLQLGPRRFKVVVDAGNGAGGPTAVALYRRLGFDVVPLYCDLDGRFPNHHPDPTQPENLARPDRDGAGEGAELGIALDGDADRHRRGRRQRAAILWGDQLMILLGKALLAEVPGAKFVGEVKCSQAMYDELAAAGGQVEMWKVGHSLIKARMKETGAQLAGEMSRPHVLRAPLARLRRRDLRGRAAARAAVARRAHARRARGRAAGDDQHAGDPHRLPRRQKFARRRAR